MVTITDLVAADWFGFILPIILERVQNSLFNNLMAVVEFTCLGVLLKRLPITLEN